MLKKFLRAAPAVLFLLALSACGDKADDLAVSAPPSAETPDGAVLGVVTRLKAGDIDGLLRAAVPPEGYARLRAEWAQKRASIVVSEEERAEFAATMRKLAAPDAAETMAAEFEPQRKKFETEYEPMRSTYVSMGIAWLQAGLQADKTVSENSRNEAEAIIGALGAWARTAPFTDRELLHKSLMILTRAVREMHVESVDQALALDFEQAMGKLGIGFLALKDVLATYGLSLDDWLDSVRVEVLENNGQTARVAFRYTLLGAALHGTADLVKVDGRWYGREAVERFKAPIESTSADTRDGAGGA